MQTKTNKTADTKQYYKAYREEHREDYKYRDHLTYWNRKFKAFGMDVKSIDTTGLDKQETDLLYRLIHTKKAIESRNPSILDRIK